MEIVEQHWTFNKDYRDYEQVRQFLPAFMARLAELEAAGQYRYNSSFKGHIPGAEGPCEDSAIYMLQNLEQWNREAAQEAALVAQGYEYVTDLAKPTKYSHIVLVRVREMSDTWAEYRDARLIPDSEGKPYAILPKGKRVNGYRIGERRILVKG